MAEALPVAAMDPEEHTLGLKIESYSEDGRFERSLFLSIIVKETIYVSLAVILPHQSQEKILSPQHVSVKTKTFGLKIIV